MFILIGLRNYFVSVYLGKYIIILFQFDVELNSFFFIFCLIKIENLKYGIWFKCFENDMDNLKVCMF